MPRMRCQRVLVLTFSLLLIRALGSLETFCHAQDEAHTSMEVPRPSLDSFEPAARDRIEAVRRTVADLVAGGAPAPKLAEGFSFLGHLYHAFDLLDAAEVCYSNAHRGAPDDYRWLYFRGLIRHAQGRLEEARGDYETVIGLEPELYAVRIRLGRLLLALDRFEEAGEHFQKALDLDPQGGRAAALVGLGRVAERRGDGAAAESRFREALALDPESGAIRYALGQSLRRSGRIEESRPFLGRIATEDVAFPDPVAAAILQVRRAMAVEVVFDLAAAEDFAERDFLGFVLTHVASAPGAGEVLEQAVARVEEAGEVSPVAVGRVRFALAELLVRGQRSEAAVEQYTRALELDPDLVGARVGLGNALASKGEFAAAVALFDEALARRPGRVEVLVQRAAALSNLQRFDAAVADLELALREGGDPELIRVAHYQLAELARRRGELEAAVGHFQHALELDRSYAAAIHGLGSTLGQLGRYRESAEAFARLVELEPGNAVARLGEVTALVLGGFHARARECLEAGLAADPDNLDFKDVLARHLAASPDLAVRDGARAVDLAREIYAAVASAESVETLAMAHAQAGNLDEAVAWQRRLIAEWSTGRDERVLDRWRRQLQLYELGHPCCAD